MSSDEGRGPSKLTLGIGLRDLFDLTGRRALVTGASRGIGRAIAVGFAAFGADVLAVARSGDHLAKTAALAAGLPGQIVPRAADLRDPVLIEGAVEASVDLFGGLDILVNNAADDHETSIEDTDLATFQRVVELNLQSCWLLCKAASVPLAEGDVGKVINIASARGVVGARNDMAYVAAKHGLVGITRSLALEWGPRNVQVNALAPGWVETDMSRPALERPGFADWVRSIHPIGRWAQPEEMIGAAVFLASAASNFVTGHVLLVDGGRTAE